MVSERCARGIADFVNAVSPGLTTDEIKGLGGQLVSTNCEGEFKKIFFNDNLRHEDPGLQETMDLIANTDPGAIRPNSYIEFADDIVTIADAETTGKRLSGGAEEASRIVHTAVTTQEANPLRPTCGRMDTNVERLSQLLKLAQNSSPETCMRVMAEISK